MRCALRREPRAIPNTPLMGTGISDVMQKGYNGAEFLNIAEAECVRYANDDLIFQTDRNEIAQGAKGAEVNKLPHRKMGNIRNVKQLRSDILALLCPMKFHFRTVHHILIAGIFLFGRKGAFQLIKSCSGMGFISTRNLCPLMRKRDTQTDFDASNGIKQKIADSAVEHVDSFDIFPVGIRQKGVLGDAVNS